MPPTPSALAWDSPSSAVYVRRRESESKCDSLLLTFSSFPLLSYSFFPAWPLSARPAVGASFVLLGTILRLRRRRRRRWWWCWWWRCCLCRCLCWCCWWWWWWVLFIFGTCEKNTLEHIKLRMLKMLYGFSVRFISILYVLFIYIRLCRCSLLILHPPPAHTHSHTEPSSALPLGTLPPLPNVLQPFSEGWVLCVCECVWVRFQFRFQLFSLFFLKNDSETNRKIIGCCHCHVLAFFCFPFLFSCRINFFPATCSEFPNAS